ncbi:TPA: hypothetical protein O9A75_000168 [Staphylococcus aureus]|nr:hypothetical protein [Staphylococcus aureus]
MELNEMINFVKENNKIIVTLSLTLFTSVIFPELKSWYSKIINTENKYRIFDRAIIMIGTVLPMYFLLGFLNYKIYIKLLERPHSEFINTICFSLIGISYGLILFIAISTYRNYLAIVNRFQLYKMCGNCDYIHPYRFVVNKESTLIKDCFKVGNNDLYEPGSNYKIINLNQTIYGHYEKVESFYQNKNDKIFHIITLNRKNLIRSWLFINNWSIILCRFTMPIVFTLFIFSLSYFDNGIYNAFIPIVIYIFTFVFQSIIFNKIYTENKQLRTQYIQKLNSGIEV